MSKRIRKTAARSSFDLRNPTLNLIIFALALLGVLVTVHLGIQQSRGFDQGCWGFNPDSAVSAFDCQAVTQSEAGTLFGVSNTYWGILFYILVALLSAGIAYAGQSVFRRLKKARAVIITAGIVYSAYLVVYQYTELDQFCALCLVSAGIAALLFGVQSVDMMKREHVVQAQGQASATRRLVFYPVLALVAVVLIGADFVYFRSMGLPEMRLAASGQVLSPFDDSECGYNPAFNQVIDLNSIIQSDDPYKGDPDAPVTVVEFLDPNCGFCLQLHPIMTRVAQRHSDIARFVYKPVVVLRPSPAQVAALHYAAEHGHFFEMLDSQFERGTGGISVDELKQISDDLGLDGDELEELLQAEAYVPKMQQTRSEFQRIGLTGVPTVIINGRVVAGESRTEECLGRLIEAEAAR